MGIFGNGSAARAEERLASVLKAQERHYADFVRRADHTEADMKALETGVRADLQGITAALGRIEGLLKARNGNGAARAAVKKGAAPAGYLTGGGGLVYLIQHFLAG